MKEWMDGWMDGWIYGWMEGWLVGAVGVWNEQPNKEINEQMNK